MPIKEKNSAASINWKSMKLEEREEWNKMAEQQEKPCLEDLSDIQKKKLVDAALKRIDTEVLFIKIMCQDTLEIWLFLAIYV